MRWTSYVALVFAILGLAAQAAPIGEVSELGQLSHLQALSEWEKDASQVAEKVEESERKVARWDKTAKKWGLATLGMYFVGGLGYVASGAIARVGLDRQRHQAKDLQQAIDQANARAAAAATRSEGPMSSTESPSLSSKMTRRALGVDAGATLIETKLPEAESIVSNLPGRAYSERWNELVSQLQDHGNTLGGSPLFSANPSRAASQYHTPLGGVSPAWHPHGLAPSISSDIQQQLDGHRSELEQAALHQRLENLEEELLELKRKQAGGSKGPDKTAKILLVGGATTALAGIASAELVVQNAYDSSIKPHNTPDVTNLDPATCEKLARTFSSLDCSKAKGPGDAASSPS
ncbi:hypothetical protein BCV70DRAFT_206083 [Testicularia cyperi]|uniref:Peroxin-14 n=1 Tax=Testicularia cyperi TaxID=1882483 RepID=A0A317XS79_9BASI|nr:hypothetical protein BCV70DRAFT_206083 [Testicularia cyperi]